MSKESKMKRYTPASRYVIHRWMSWLDLTSYLWLAWGVYWLVAAFRVNPVRASETFWQRLQHLLPLATGFALIYRFDFGPLYDSSLMGICGVTLTAMGFAYAIWARVHLGRYWSGMITIKEGHRLIRTGPYRFVRHPIYTGILMALDRKSVV